MKKEKMTLIANKRKNGEFIPMLHLIKESTEELKKEAKKQLMTEIINNPKSLKGYKELEVYKIAEVNEELEIKNYKKELLFSYEEILEEIIENLTKEQKNEQIK